MKQALLVFLLTVNIAILAADQERPLQAVDRPAISGEKRCPPYFATTTFGGATAEQIVFAYQAADGNIKHDTVPKARATIQLREGQTLSYESVAVDGQSGAVFRLNQSEYQKARECLPEPKSQSHSVQ